MNIRFPLLLDGAMGTQLHKKGLTPGCCPEQWVLEHPEVCESIQRAYVDAGSQVIYAPTFGASSAVMESHGIFSEVEAYNRALVGLARRTAGESALVAGDISSVGAMLYPLGDTSFEELYGVYLEQAQALENAGVDLFVIETMTNVAEARAALLAVKEVSTKPVFVSFSCDANGKTMMGTDVCAALQIMQSMGADAFGLNCSVGPAEMIPQLRRLYEYAYIPLIAKPNAGLPESVDGETVFSVDAETFAGYIPALAEAGASIFGACCGSDETYIAAIRRALNDVSVRAPAPKKTELFPCATEKELFLLDPALEDMEVYACDDELEDNISEPDKGQILGIEIRSLEDVAAFSDVQYAIRNPLCLICDDAALLEKALRAYQGTAIYSGTLGEDVLLPLAKKYGLIL